MDRSSSHTAFYAELVLMVSITQITKHDNDHPSRWQSKKTPIK